MVQPVARKGRELAVNRCTIAGRSGRIVWILAILTAAASLGLTVNPWSRDGWFQTQYYLIGRFPGRDDYTPIAAPALLFKGAHAIARLLGRGLAGEFYVASILQNLLLLASACFVYRALKLLRLERIAGPAAVVFLLFALSTGVAQWFYSEGTSLFLMSGVVLALAAILRKEPQTPGRFWMLSFTCALAVGLLVATRMTPVFLIPGGAFLLFRHRPLRRVVQFTGTLTVVTAGMLGAMILANHARFGRYEITNSTGRHLWQGVKDFSDRALAGSARYRALKRLEPHVQGKYWDTLPPLVDDPSRVDPREAMLRELAEEAIRNAPHLYLMHGAAKFVTTIGMAPSRDAFYRMPGEWNPLHRTTNLPSLLDEIGAPPVLSEAVDAFYRMAYVIFTWLYPISLFAVGMTCLTAILPRRLGARAALAIFHAMGMALVCIPLARFGLRLEGIAGSALCALMLGACGALLQRTLRDRSAPDSAAHAWAGTLTRFLLFAALIFFGSLWFTWQIEVGSPRYALPYMPFWAIMLALSLGYWRELDAQIAWGRLASEGREVGDTGREAGAVSAA